MSSSTPTPQAADRPHASTSFWRSVAQALSGEHHDYTAERLNRAVLLLAVPMVLEMVMESLFAVVDVFWVSRLGKDAVAVVGITESIMTLIYAVAIGISIAATAIVARRIGEKDPERAAQAAGQIVLLGVGVAAGIGVVLGYFAPDILRLMGASEAIVALGTDFARIMLGGNATVFLIFLINAIFRGAGDAVLAMRTLWLANALNIALGPCFIFGWGPFPEMGVTGAAVATNIGRGIGVLYQLWHLAGHHSRVRVRLRHLRPAREDAHGASAHRRQRHRATAHQHHELGRAVQDPRALRQRRARRLHHRHPHRHLRADAGVGPRQRRRDARRPEPRRGQARARRGRGVDRRRASTCVPRHRRRRLRRLRAIRWRGLFTSDPEVLAYGARALVDRQPRLSALRRRHVSRRRRSTAPATRGRRRA